MTTVMRVPDALGLDADDVEIQLGDGSIPEYIVAIFSDAVESQRWEARVDRIERAGLPNRAAGLRVFFVRYESDAPDWLRVMLAEAERDAYKKLARSFLLRDQARQAGTKKRRRVDIDQWIDAELHRDSSAKSPDLWGRAPESITDQIGFGSFMKRVTKSRKRASNN